MFSLIGTDKGADHYACKSTDNLSEHAEGIRNGSDAYEMDTQKVYMFDADAKTWIEQ